MALEHHEPYLYTLYRLMYSALRYTISPVIKTIRDKETVKVFGRLRSSKLPSDMQQVAYRKLRYLNNARTLKDLRVPPASRLEKLKGDRSGQHSIRINDQWRICFRWQRNDAYDVEIVDYHA